MDSLSKQYIDSLITVVQNLYLSDEIPWMIGYSGGKDSTATVQLVWMAIAQLPPEKRIKNVHIMNTNTRVESPVIERWVGNSLDLMRRAASEQGLPFRIERLAPSWDNTFWVNLIGRGYPFPRMKYRWCTDRLKIQPVNKFIKEKIAEHGEVVLVLGTRKQESTRRAKVMTDLEQKRVRELLSPNPTLANELVFSPLEAWSDDDVWVFLMQYRNPWGFPNTELLKLYRGASADNECPLMQDLNLPSCGKSRFGCWVCTMVDKDKSMEAMIANDEDKAWMSQLLEFRNYFGDLDRDRDRRSFRRMRGNIESRSGRLLHGPYKKEVREEWLRRLLRMQRNIQETGPQGFSDLELIHVEELRKIRRIWVNDKHEFCDSLPVIYQEEIGKPFDDPEWIDTRPFGIEEWNILKETCEMLFEDEELAFEMMYSLVDLEVTAAQQNDRREIMTKVEKVIENNFYKNEDDALQFRVSQEELQSRLEDGEMPSMGEGTLEELDED